MADHTDIFLSIGEVVGGAAIAVSTYVRGRHIGKDKGLDEGAATERQRIIAELTSCREREHKLRTRLSAMETEMVTLRKLLPGGEWYVKLGLEDHPSGSAIPTKDNG